MFWWLSKLFAHAYLVANGEFYRDFPHCPTGEDANIVLLSVYLPPSLFLVYDSV